ncbi:IS5 family transposase [Methylomonas sp. AM2-LC]|uniref:IS5 family transposase n=1 Tax=Methylomonas sp. AM2-LC TaxID=3153301 RepID=UPI003266F2C8
MPYKYNEKIRDKIDKPRYKVTNWPAYNNALRNRGDFTVYFTEEAIAEWHPAKTGSRGSPQKYSALAIETSLMIRQVFRLPLRQTQGFMNSLITALDIDITIPDFSNLSKRSVALPRHKLTQELAPGSIVIVDSTGLKVYGKDEWHQEKHEVAARRTWRKLHLAVDENHQIIACELTTPETGDPSAVPDLLDQIDTPFDTFIADGAYDGDPVCKAVLSLKPDAQVIVPPHKTAVCSPAGDSQRDNHIKVIDQYGRIAWQKKTGYGLRNYVELAMQRYKRIFGNTMKARQLPQQKAEALASAVALNRMTDLGMPVSVKI